MNNINRTDFSEGTDVNKSSTWKDCNICCYGNF